MAFIKEHSKLHLGIYPLNALIMISLHFLLGLDSISDYLGFIEVYIPFLKNLTFALSIIFIILAIRNLLNALISKIDQNEGEIYNLNRIIRLIALALVAYVSITFLFQEPYKGLAGLGIVSLILGFALQAPITSFIAWLYIIFRTPYKVGDRIQINENCGVVIEISYLDTILEEFSGDYLGNDRKSGRMIYFPNSRILIDKVINYSGPIAPFIWNETPIQIAFDSDIEFVEECLKEASVRDFKEKYPTRSLVGNEPDVYFRVNDYSWMEAVVSYPVEPNDTTGRRNRILRYALPLLNAQPDKVKYPIGRRR